MAEIDVDAYSMIKCSSHDCNNLHFHITTNKKLKQNYHIQNSASH